MTIADGFVLLFSAIAGGAIGLFYFGGLWLTVRQLPTARQPGLLVLGSFIGRLAVSLLAFYLIAGGQWPRLLAALAGFILARLALVRRWGTEVTG